MAAEQSLKYNFLLMIGSAISVVVLICIIMFGIQYTTSSSAIKPLNSISLRPLPPIEPAATKNMANPPLVSSSPQPRSASTTLPNSPTSSTTPPNQQKKEYRIAEIPGFRITNLDDWSVPKLVSGGQLGQSKQYRLTKNNAEVVLDFKMSDYVPPASTPSFPIIQDGQCVDIGKTWNRCRVEIVNLGTTNTNLPNTRMFYAQYPRPEQIPGPYPAAKIEMQAYLYDVIYTTGLVSLKITLQSDNLLDRTIGDNLVSSIAF